MSILERFMSKVDITDECWTWIALKNRHGYGRFIVDRKSKLAHKWYWEQINGPVSDGLELDHLCKNKSCVRLDHLEPVSHQENCKRAYGEECQRGHSGDWYIQPDGRRRCRSCIRAYEKTYVRKNPDRDRANAAARQRRYQQRKKMRETDG